MFNFKNAKEFRQIVDGLHLDDKINLDHKQKLKQQMLKEFDRQMAKKSQGRDWRMIGRKIMNSTITKYAAAAIIILVAAISIAKLDIDETNKADGGITQEVEIKENDTVAKNQSILNWQKKINQMQATGDWNALAELMAASDEKTKAAIASYIMAIGDEAAVKALKGLGGDKAIVQKKELPKSPRSRRRSIDTPKSAVAKKTIVKKKIKGDKLCQLLPSDAMFCLRVNKLETTIFNIDQYVKGVSPVPAGVSMLVRMQLNRWLSDPALKNLAINGDFAFFVANVEIAAADADKVTDKWVPALIMPVTDFDKLVADNDKILPPDANGIAKINAEKMIIKDLGGFVMICDTKNYNQLLNLAKNIAEGKTLAIDKPAEAAANAIWVYVDMQELSTKFSPEIKAKLESVKKEFARGSKNGYSPPPEVMGFYAGLWDIMAKEVKSLTLVSNPSAKLWKSSMDIEAVEGTIMARMFTPSKTVRKNDMLRYLSNGAFFNFGLRTDTVFFEELNMFSYDMISFFVEKEISSNLFEQAQKIISSLAQNSAGSAAISMKFDKEKRFEQRKIWRIKNAEAVKKTNDAIMALWQSQNLYDYVKNIGIEMVFEKLPQDEYKDIVIDKVKIAMEADDPNGPYGKLINQMYKGGFRISSAIVDDISLEVVTCDCNEQAGELVNNFIDEVLAGGPNEVPSEIAECLATFDNAIAADFVGTLNVVRYMRIIGTMLADIDHSLWAMSQIDMESQSNLVFAGRVGRNKLTLESALSRTHFDEICQAVQQVGKNKNKVRIAEDDKGFTADSQIDTWHFVSHDMIKVVAKIELDMVADDFEMPITLPYKQAKMTSAKMAGTILESIYVGDDRYIIVLPEDWVQRPVELRKIQICWDLPFDSLTYQTTGKYQGYRANLDSVIPSKAYRLQIILEQGCGFEKEGCAKNKKWTPFWNETRLGSATTRGTCGVDVVKIEQKVTDINEPEKELSHFDSFPATADEYVPAELLQYVVGFHENALTQANIEQDIRTNTLIFIINEDDLFMSGNILVAKNCSDKPQTEIYLGNFSPAQIALYDESGKRLESQMRNSLLKIAGPKKLYWLADEPLMPGQTKTMICYSNHFGGGTRDASDALDKGEFPLTMQNHFGQEVLENFVLILSPDKIIGDSSVDYTMAESVGDYDIYIWQKHVKGSVNNQVKAKIIRK